MNLIKARCTFCLKEYSINPTSENDKNLKIRHPLIPKIYCANCGNDNFNLYIKFGVDKK